MRKKIQYFIFTTIERSREEGELCLSPQVVDSRLWYELEFFSDNISQNTHFKLLQRTRRFVLSTKVNIFVFRRIFLNVKLFYFWVLTTEDPEEKAISPLSHLQQMAFPLLENWTCTMSNIREMQSVCSTTNATLLSRGLSAKNLVWKSCK